MSKQGLSGVERVLLEVAGLHQFLGLKGLGEISRTAEAAEWILVFALRSAWSDPGIPHLSEFRICQTPLN